MAVPAAQGLPHPGHWVKCRIRSGSCGFCLSLSSSDFSKKSVHGRKSASPISLIFFHRDRIWLPRAFCFGAHKELILQPRAQLWQAGTGGGRNARQRGHLFRLGLGTRQRHRGQNRASEALLTGIWLISIFATAGRQREKQRPRCRAIPPELLLSRAPSA